jgi:hypothetical protein
MRKFRRQTPYNNNGSTNFRYTYGKSGCYIIYKKDKPVYVGISKTNVYKAMYSHFQSWHDKTQERITYKSKAMKLFLCRVILCSPMQAVRLEKMLILKYKPKDNPEKYLNFTAEKPDVKVYDDFIGAPVEYCPDF